MPTIVLGFVVLLCKSSEKELARFPEVQLKVGAVSGKALRCAVGVDVAVVNAMPLTTLARRKNLHIIPRCHELPKSAFERGPRELSHYRTYSDFYH